LAALGQGDGQLVAPARLQLLLFNEVLNQRSNEAIAIGELRVEALCQRLGPVALHQRCIALAELT